MKRKIPGGLAMLVPLLIWNLGCVSIYTATTPPPVDDQGIRLGMTIEEVDDILDGTSEAAPFDGGTRVTYRYEDIESWKNRHGLYASAGPADWIFVFVEGWVQYRGQRWASGLYDARGLLVHFTSRDIDDDLEIEVGETPKLERKPRRYTFLRAVLGDTALTRGGGYDDDELE